MYLYAAFNSAHFKISTKWLTSFQRRVQIQIPCKTCFDWNCVSGVELKKKSELVHVNLGAGQEIGHYLERWWRSSLTHINVVCRMVAILLCLLLPKSEAPDWLQCKGRYVPSCDSSSPKLDSFTVSSHSPNGRYLHGDCQWPLENGGDSHRSRETEMLRIRDIPH